jgi:cytoskeletal protein CcmA (bactofilin family)
MGVGFKKVSDSKILTVIGKEASIKGNLQASGALRIDGRVQGEIEVSGDLIIGEGAIIDATVKGKNIQVAGRVNGNIEALGTLEIQASGVVQGDVNIKSLVVADGAVLIGACTMKQQEPKK